MATRPLALLGLLAIAGCRQADTAAQSEDRRMAEADSVRPMFDSAFGNYNREYNAGNIEPLISRYAPTAHIMPPNAPAIGRDSLRALFTAAFRGGSNGTIHVGLEHIIRSGPLAVVRAHWTFQSREPNAPADSGSSVTVWSLGADGRWSIIEDIWHSDLPVKP